MKTGKVNKSVIHVDNNRAYNDRMLGSVYYAMYYLYIKMFYIYINSFNVYINPME